jgi:hypothetical protein
MTITCVTFTNTDIGRSMNKCKWYAVILCSAASILSGSAALGAAIYGTPRVAMAWGIATPSVWAFYFAVSRSGKSTFPHIFRFALALCAIFIGGILLTICQTILESNLPDSLFPVTFSLFAIILLPPLVLFLKHGYRSIHS